MLLTLDLSLFLISSTVASALVSLRSRSHPLMIAISYGVTELLLDVSRALLGDSVQLTGDLDLEKAKIDKIDEEQLQKLYSEYEKASA